MAGGVAFVRSCRLSPGPAFPGTRADAVFSGPQVRDTCRRVDAGISSGRSDTVAVMARKTVTTTDYTDDLDGSPASATIRFGFDGGSYEIDLNKTNARAFGKALKPYVDAGRKVRPRPKASSRGKPAATHDLAAIRDWAKNAGYDVSDRGRVATAVIEAFEAAH